MSRTPTLGVVGVRYWAYMAYVMMPCLDRISTGHKTEIPRNVLLEAQKFFKIVLSQKTGDTMFDNQPAQLHAHVIAWDVLNDCPPLVSRTIEEADDHFRKLAKLLEKLEKPVDLNEEDKKTANELGNFFAALWRKNAREGRG